VIRLNIIYGNKDFSPSGKTHKQTKLDRYGR